MDTKSVNQDVLSKLLNDDGSGTSTTVADAGAPKLSLLEEAGEGDDDPGARAADGVAKGDRASCHVDLCGINVQDLIKGEFEQGKEGKGEFSGSWCFADALRFFRPSGLRARQRQRPR